MSAKRKRKTAQEQSTQVVAGSGGGAAVPLIPGGVRITSTIQARRLVGRLIKLYCAGLITGEAARTVAWLCSTYSQLTAQSDFEQRLSELEKHVAGGM